MYYTIPQQVFVDPGCRYTYYTEFCSELRNSFYILQNNVDSIAYTYKNDNNN